ncbi:uncharacterized protein DNG_02779 [Cephalotrichum gorgonifer]|uniref:P450 domain-containing protein n=1 Tax=Cephalotrichum gorgonifer TaxID=2041049 RepID=A0AAE8MV31_9PEZI|nr:uncharacterized protein DNG_02779 [Cephalotrichum gorgonifer]
MALYTSQYLLTHISQVGTLSVAVGSVAVLILLSYVRTFVSCQLKGLQGPAWTKFSGLDMTISVIQGRRVHRLLDLHRQYGPIVRVGPNEVSISDWKYYRPLYNNPAALKEVDFYSPFILGKGSLFQMTNPDQHTARRKLSNPTYSLRSITALNPLIRGLADQLVMDLLHESENSPTGTANAFDHSALYSFKVICKLAFSKDFAADEAEDLQTLLDAMNGSIFAFLVDKIFPWLRSSGLANKIPGPVGEGCRKHDHWAEKTREMVDGLLKSSGEDAKFFLTPVAHGVDEFFGRKLSEIELVAEAMGVMVGGSGTLSTTLTYLLYELSRPENAHVQKRLREEVLEIPDTENISALRNNAYVKAVITETLRLYPSIVSTLPRVLPEPLTLGEHVIPPGTVVGMQHFVHQRDPQIFPEPDRWTPERWFDRTEEMNGAFTAFSVGKRACIGLNLAWEELYLAINAFVRAGVEIRLGKEMKASDMEIEDRFAAIPRGQKLMLEVVRL